MVNSKKKMNKSTVAIVVLALLLVLSLVLTATGAWFTDKKSGEATGTGTDVKFGTIGSVTLTLTGAQWQDVNKEDVTDRDYYMPGDKVTSAGLKIEHTAGSEEKVYYVVTDGTNYYTIEGVALKALDGTDAAELTAGSKLEATGKVAAVTADSKTYRLDGEKTAEDGLASGNISNGAQAKGLDAIVGISMNKVTYKVGIIQSTNLTATEALTQLKTLLE